MADEPENTESTDDPPAALRSGRVRIVGAEPAEQRAASLAPELPDDADFVLSPSETGLDLRSSPTRPTRRRVRRLARGAS